MICKEATPLTSQTLQTSIPSSSYSHSILSSGLINWQPTYDTRGGQRIPAAGNALTDAKMMTLLAMCKSAQGLCDIIRYLSIDVSFNQFFMFLPQRTLNQMRYFQLAQPEYRSKPDIQMCGTRVKEYNPCQDKIGQVP